MGGPPGGGNGQAGEPGGNVFKLIIAYRRRRWNRVVLRKLPNEKLPNEEEAQGRPSLGFRPALMILPNLSVVTRNCILI